MNEKICKRGNLPRNFRIYEDEKILELDCDKISKVVTDAFSEVEDKGISIGDIGVDWNEIFISVAYDSNWHEKNGVDSSLFSDVINIKKKIKKKLREDKCKVIVDYDYYGNDYFFNIQSEYEDEKLICKTPFKSDIYSSIEYSPLHEWTE